AYSLELGGDGVLYIDGGVNRCGELSSLGGDSAVETSVSSTVETVPSTSTVETVTSTLEKETSSTVESTVSSTLEDSISDESQSSAPGFPVWVVLALVLIIFIVLFVVVLVFGVVKIRKRRGDKEVVEDKVEAKEEGVKRLFCPYCGNKIKTSCKFCERCGKKVG
ncbi:MAG: zinc ribbon domain-containing protein, partial [Candidatus Altiarchaeales archaeon]|nr:zinc ribbon domain-containing protein [Candidatus Altiarchaeales archaeon]